MHVTSAIKLYPRRFVIETKSEIKNVFGILGCSDLEVELSEATGGLISVAHMSAVLFPWCRLVWRPLLNN